MHCTAFSDIYEAQSSVLDLTDAFSLEAWVRPEALPAEGMRIVDKSPVGAQSGYMLDTYPGGSVRFLLAEGMLTAHHVLHAGEWTHVVGVFSAAEGVYRVYVNGRLAADGSRRGMRPAERNDLPLRIGADSQGGHRFIGDIDRVTIYGRVVSEREVARLAAAPRTQPPALNGRVADWRLIGPVRSEWPTHAAGGPTLQGPFCGAGEASPPRHAGRSLWYRQPSRDWNDALPLGNGRLGAMVFGGVPRERIQCNEDTFWSGRPHDYSVDGASGSLPEIRRLMFAGRNNEAAALGSRTLMGSPVLQQAYQPLADLLLSFGHAGRIYDYRRDLDLFDGVASVRYRCNGVIYTRSVFISATDQVVAARLTASKPVLDVTVRIVSPHPHRVMVDDAGCLVMSGAWKGDGRDQGLTAGVQGEGLRFEAGLHVETPGEVTRSAEGVHIRNASTVVIRLCAATSFRNYRDISGDPSAVWRPQMQRAQRIPFERLLATHKRDMRRYMERVGIDLGDPQKTRIPTDTRLDQVRQGGTDRHLAALYFQYGRYLLLCGSRPGTQPANLQGIWNQDLAPAWGSKWTVNINTEMNYWPAEVCNLTECHEPLFDLLQDLAETGAVVAHRHYGARGWVLHHNADLWRGAAPIDGVHGIWPMGAAWLSSHLWEHFLFTGDQDFLEQRAWPLMRGAALFMLDFLTEAPSHTPVAGKLVTCPSHSPENTFWLREGESSMFTYAASMDLMIVRRLFLQCLSALDRLGTPESKADSALRRQITHALNNLAPVRISPRDGRLMEWVEDYAEVEPGHRHMSHLYALHPGEQITPEHTPEFAAAARRSLDTRLSHGGGGTGWSRAWLVNLFARLQDGAAAYTHLQDLLARCTLPNLFDNHPPFQIDGNFGATAGIAEMLLQSHAGRIHLLPALPPQWPDGSVRGCRARGGVTVQIRWAQGRLVEASLRADRKGMHRIRSMDREMEWNALPGRTLRISG